MELSGIGRYFSKSHDTFWEVGVGRNPTDRGERLSSPSVTMWWDCHRAWAKDPLERLDRFNRRRPSRTNAFLPGDTQKARFVDRQSGGSRRMANR